MQLARDEKQILNKIYELYPAGSSVFRRRSMLDQHLWATIPASIGMPKSHAFAQQKYAALGII